MREMHKWKDKVELSLDNRQIFFLFFGLSIVGCFVFALGVMVGRRVEFDPSSEVAALSADSLSLLDGHAEQESDLTFKEGLKDSASDEVPPTRDPDAVVEDADAAPSIPAAAIAAAPAPKPAEAAKPSAAQKTKPGAKKPSAKASGNKSTKTGNKTTLAAAAPGAKPSATPVGQKFTLQMKAFAKAEEAEAFAAKLKAGGHQARVEAHEVKGRLWHRVRVGEFTTWAAGLQAKENFEHSEKIIAYVVRK